MVSCARHSRHTAFTTQPITFTRGADDARTPHTQNNIPSASAIASSKKIQTPTHVHRFRCCPAPPAHDLVRRCVVTDAVARRRHCRSTHSRTSPLLLPRRPTSHRITVRAFAPSSSNYFAREGLTGNRRRASTKEHFTRVAAGSTGQRGGIKYNGNLLAVNAQTHTRTTLHTLLLRSSSTQAAQRWKEVPAPHRYDFRRPTRRAFSRRVAAAF
jgi:hypothetical protein